MRPLRSTLGVLSISPALHLQCSACRNPLLLTQLDLRAQCPQTHSVGGDNFPWSRRFLSSQSGRPYAQTGFSYRVASSFSAKGRRFRSRENFFTFNTSQSTDIFTGRPDSGQDAFFIAALGGNEKHGVAFGVADGVGGWADSGIDSAEFSHGLCEAMATTTTDVVIEENSFKQDLGPKSLLDSAYRGIVEDGQIAGGGSTACVAVGKGDGSLDVANLGDSGFVQIRPAAIHYNSNPQTHAFNTPFQLSIVPPRILALSRAFGGGPLSDLPEAADISHHMVRHGDVLVFATDGVWDNLSPEDLLRVVNRRMTESGAWTRGNETDAIEVSDRIIRLTTQGYMPQIDGVEHDTLQTSLAVSIVAEAKTASLDTKRDGPFAREVRKFYPMEEYHGGKVDDICVVVAVVVVEGERRLKLHKEDGI